MAVVVRVAPLDDVLPEVWANARNPVNRAPSHPQGVFFIKADNTEVGTTSYGGIVPAEINGGLCG